VTLVLLPAIGLDSRCWDWTPIGEIAGAVKVEYPGFGSRPAVSRDYSLADLADEVAATVDGDLDVVGVSMGGMVAQHLALRHPDRVRSLLLACTTGAVNPQPVMERAHLAESGRMDELADATLHLWFTDRFLSTSPERSELAYAKHALRTADPPSFARGWRAVAGHRVLDRLEEIRVPVTCVAGERDVSTPPEVLETLHSRIAGSRFVICPGPHLLPLEAPGAFDEAVRDHLDRVAVA
jgi:pimeloyl-ACP methyl ester carboxylesterase